MPGSSDKLSEEILLARRMFFAGCLGLPWLWICNALYFRTQVFGPLVVVDYWPGHAPPPAAEGGSGGDGGGSGDDPQRMERELERQMQRSELKKWVKRSSIGAVGVMSAFVAWIVSFQIYKEHFGPKWFVMSESDADVSGW